jgi:hypothetical protein
VAAPLDIPAAIVTADEAIIGSGKGWIAKDIRVIGWIDAIEAARHHKSALARPIETQLDQAADVVTRRARNTASAAAALLAVMWRSP